MTVAHPIAHAWITTGGTGAQNYDEFADEAEITEIIRANPHSALAVEMPHRAPENLGRGFTASLPDAVSRLAEAKADGSYTPAEQAVVLYRITEPAGDEPAFGLFCMVDTDQISASADEPGLVIRNEDVFLEKVRERVALAEATGHLLSPVLLLQTAGGDDLHAALAAACEDAGAPAATDLDQAGRTHAIWLLPPGPRQDELLALVGTGELVVADGNHRSLAAQIGGLPRFLAVVTTPDSVTIQPYNRLISELTTTVEGLLARLAVAGARIEAIAGRPAIPDRPGVVHLYVAGQAYAAELPRTTAGGLSTLSTASTPGELGACAPPPKTGSGCARPEAEQLTMVDNLDHALVERVLLREVLGLDPGDKRITYVGGDYSASWLAAQVDSGHAELAVLIGPVTVADFVAVNLARLKLPRKSTWFTPKARAGLVLTQLEG